MNSLKVIAGSMIVLALAGGAVACDSQPSDVDVIQEGGYDSMHVYHVWPQSQWTVVHVSYNVYHSNSRLYSTPSYEKTYVKTHTITTINKTVNVPRPPVVKAPMDKIPVKTTVTKKPVVTSTRKR